jgi:hypothetical protein
VAIPHRARLARLLFAGPPGPARERTRSHSESSAGRRDSLARGTVTQAGTLSDEAFGPAAGARRARGRGGLCRAGLGLGCRDGTLDWAPGPGAARRFKFGLRQARTQTQADAVQVTVLLLA